MLDEMGSSSPNFRLKIKRVSHHHLGKTSSLQQFETGGVQVFLTFSCDL